MSERGVYAIDRGLWDDPDFADEPYTEKQAFAWLIGAAAWEDVRIRIGTIGPIALKRGEFCYSVRFLADKWQWSKSRVSRFLERLKNRDTLRDTSRDSVNVYFISNYNRFQIVALPNRDTERDTKRDSSGTAAGQQRDKEEDIIRHLKVSSAREQCEQLCEALGISLTADPKRVTWPEQLSKLLEQGVQLQDLITAAKSLAGRNSSVKSLMYLKPIADQVKAERLAAEASLSEFKNTDAFGWERRFSLFYSGEQDEWPAIWGGTAPGTHPAHPKDILDRIKANPPAKRVRPPWESAA